MSVRAGGAVARALRAVDPRAIVSWLGLYYLIVFLLLAWVRVPFPYEIDNLEGGMLAMCQRLLLGQPLYAPPSLEYVPFLYPPLYFYAAAYLMKLCGPGYLALRALTLMSTLGITLLLYALVRRKTQAGWPALAAVGIFLGYFCRGTFNYDTGRVDLLALFLFLASAACALRPAAPLWALAGGALGGLSVLCKQSLVALLPWVGLWLLCQRGRRGAGLIYLLSAALAGVLFLRACDLLTDPWLYYYVFTVPAHHHVSASRALIEAPVYLLLTLPLALWVGLPGPRRDPWALLLWVGAVSLSVMHAKDAASFNHFVPVALLAALQVGRRAEAWLAGPVGGLVGARRWLLVGQLLILYYPPRVVAPGPRDVAAARHIVATIAALPGDVYVPAYPAYAARAGKPWHAHHIASCDVLQIDPDFRAALDRDLHRRRFAAILPRTDPSPFGGGVCDLPGLRGPYQPAGELPVPSAPSALDLLRGQPMLFRIVHAGQIGPIFTPSGAAAVLAQAGARTGADAAPSPGDPARSPGGPATIRKAPGLRAAPTAAAP